MKFLTITIAILRFNFFIELFDQISHNCLTLKFYLTPTDTSKDWWALVIDRFNAVCARTRCRKQKFTS